MGNDNNIYSTLLSLFVDPAKEMIKLITINAVELFKAQIIFNALMAILIMIWIYQRLKNDDTLELKTLVGLIPFIVYMGFMNWAIANPSTFMEYFYTIIFYPTNWLMDLVTKSITSMMYLPQSGTENASISYLVQQSYNAVYLIYTRVFEDLSFTNFFTRLPQLFLFGFVIIAEVAFLTLVMLIVLIVNIEVYVWISLGIIFLPLVLFKQSRGIAFSYLKKLISLTLYQPALFLFAFFNFSMIFAIIKRIPTKEEIDQGFFGKATDLMNATIDGNIGYISILGYFTIIIIGAIICFYLVKRTPDFINNLFGTSGGVGGMVEMIQKSAVVASGAIAGATAGFIGGSAKNAYEQAGGGIGGVIAGLGTLGSAGMGGGVAGKIGEAINQSKVGSKINEGINFGVQKFSGGGKS